MVLQPAADEARASAGWAPQSANNLRTKPEHPRTEPCHPNQSAHNPRTRPLGKTAEPTTRGEYGLTPTIREQSAD